MLFRSEIKHDGYTFTVYETNLRDPNCDVVGHYTGHDGYLHIIRRNMLFKSLVKNKTNEKISKYSVFINSWGTIAREIHENAVDNGQWAGRKTQEEVLISVMDKLAKVFEVVENQNFRDHKLVGFFRIEIRLADVVARIMDISHVFGYSIPEVIERQLKGIPKEQK